MESAQRQISREIDFRIHRAKRNQHDATVYKLIGATLPKYVGIYSKGLPHTDGLVSRTEIKKLLEALDRKDLELITRVELGGPIQLVNPSAAWCVDFCGMPSYCCRVGGVPELNSVRVAWNLAELYCMSLCRDIPFSQYFNDPTVAQCAKILNWKSPATLFRGAYDCYDGTDITLCANPPDYYISQFLLQDYPEGGWKRSNKCPIAAANNYMTSWKTATACQNGIVSETQSFTPGMRYIINGRDLTTYVHSDEPDQAFFRACNIMMGWKVPLFTSKIISGFVELGKPDIHDLLGRATKLALAAAWRVKWSVMFPRPEALGIEVERGSSGFLHEFFNGITDLVKSKHGNLLLHQAYPEGSPCHPSFPAGHATIAGACITVLKFFFETGTVIPTMSPNADGSALQDTGFKTTVLKELNKLATNIAFGRNFAGIHYRFDGHEGIGLGEQVALALLKDTVKRYPCPVTRVIPLYAGTTYKISTG